MLMQETNDLRRALWRLLRPIPEEIAILVAVVAVTFAVATYQLTIGGSIDPESREAVTTLGGLVRDAIATFDGASIAAKLLLFGFWFMVGTILYFIVWFGISLVIDIYNDIVISAAFMHPRSFHQSQYWTAIAGRAAVRGLSGLGLIVFGLLSIRLVGFGYVDAAKSLIQMPGLAAALTLLGSTIVVVLVIHVCVILYKLAFLKISEGSDTGA